jgi:hypothetical protein
MAHRAAARVVRVRLGAGYGSIAIKGDRIFFNPRTANKASSRA